MAQTPDPTIPLANLHGRTRTLDDWLTISHLALVVLPGKPEASKYVALGERALRVFRESDARTAFLVTGNEHAARRVLGPVAERYVVFVDNERALVNSLGLARLPAFVHLRSDCALVDAAEGWDPQAWDRVSESIAKATRWSRAVYPMPGDPAPFEGWAVA
jgi:hypothetical protein